MAFVDSSLQAVRCYCADGVQQESCPVDSAKPMLSTATTPAVEALYTIAAPDTKFVPIHLSGCNTRFLRSTTSSAPVVVPQPGGAAVFHINPYVGARHVKEHPAFNSTGV